MIEVGDIVIYKPSNDTPSRTAAAVHPAIVTRVHPSEDKKIVLWVDLTVFFHGWDPLPVMQVPLGTAGRSTACWWPK